MAARYENARYETRKIHPTALQKRLDPSSAEKPWVVWDRETGQWNGKRFRTQSGADRATGDRNRHDRQQKQAERE